MKNKKGNKKLAVAFTLIIAGSVFYGTSPASASGIELEGVQIVFGRHHDAPPPPGPPHHDMHMPPPPPPEPQRGYHPPAYHPYHRPPEPDMWDRPGGHHAHGRPEHFGPGPRGHMPPPPHR